MEIGRLNISTIRSKYDLLKEMVQKRDILIVLETELDDSFLVTQFLIKRVCALLSQNKNHGWALLQIRNHIGSAELKKIHHKQYNPKKLQISSHLQKLLQ